MFKSKSIKIILTALLLCVYIQPHLTTNAYTVLGGKYASGNITYLIQTNNNYSGAAQLGAVAWNNAGTNNVVLTSTTSQKNYNIVFKNGTYGANIGWNARCANKPVHTSGTYTRSEIDFNVSTMDSMTTEQKKGVSAHEIGHALGLDHVDDTSQIMSTWGMGRVATVPNDDDVNGANYLY